ncbi:hypothetical protein SCLCIDRAFT_971204 [Scleroderma citrinum Foug A]|uniref:Uncharacterized protein n=1 Tax=Scleroderma citrinum Foug A TaxID=1036808 RepID=A0A0C3A5Z2_9AGAM|nr:hypothetical protein SCLCIDRAFT_971204 [Scleroderma citrinum Foug A]
MEGFVCKEDTGGYQNVTVLPVAISGDRAANAASASHQIGGLTSIDQAASHQTGGLHREEGIDQVTSHQTGGLPPEERIDQAASHQRRGILPEEVVGQVASHQTGGLPPAERIDQAASYQKRSLPPEEVITQVASHQTGGLPPEERIIQVASHQGGCLLPEESEDQVAVLSCQANGVPSEELAGQAGNNSAATAGPSVGDRTPIAVTDEQTQDSSAVGGGGSATSGEIPDVVMEEHIQLGVQACTSGADDQAGYACAAAGEPVDVVMAELNQNGGPPIVDMALAAAKEIPNVVMEEGEIRNHGPASVRHDQIQDPDGQGVVVSAPRTKDTIGSDVVVPTQGKGKGKGKGKDKDNMGKTKKSGPTLPAFSLTLVHGDSLILTGDDYDCQIERIGISLLVFGSGDGA